VKGIEQGRAAFDNLRKVIAYLLPAGSFSELIPVLFNVFFGAALALSTPQMIVICIFTDVGGALALVNERRDPTLMQRPPRNAHKNHLVDLKLLFHAFCLTGICETVLAYLHFSYWMNKNGYPTSTWILQYSNLPSDNNFNNVVNIGTNLFFVTLALCQIGNLLSTRTREPLLFGWALPEHLKPALDHDDEEELLANPGAGLREPGCAASPFAQVLRKHAGVLAAIAWSVLICLLVTEAPFMNNTFQTASVPSVHWLIGCACSMVLFVLLEFRKFLICRFPNSFLKHIAW